MAASPDISRFVNKTVAFRFKGRDFSFLLSHALFSSFDIDDGTRLLLKTLAQNVDLGSLRSVLDIGCGVGVIGAAVASQAPQAAILMQDRDALAAAFARENCRVNRLDNVDVRCALAFHGLSGRTFDLVTSNLPAKAGKPVLEAMLRHAAGCLSPGGAAAIVIVAPLAAFAREVLDAAGFGIRFVEATRAYTVLHFGRSAEQPGPTGQTQSAVPAEPETDAEREDLSPYIRTSAEFSTRTCAYSLKTAHSLPDFDTLGYAVELTLDLLAETVSARDVLAWNPGQGHLPVGLLTLRGRAVTSLRIAGRDSLECAISAMNLASMDRPAASVHAIASESELAQVCPEGSIDLLIAVPRSIPRVPWQHELAAAAERLLRRNGELLVVGTSTDLHRFLDQPLSLRTKTSRKQYGFRAAILGKA